MKAIDCPKNDAITVVGFIQRNILSIFRAPRTIISDEGSHFANKVFAKLMSRYAIKHMMGLSYHPLSHPDSRSDPIEGSEPSPGRETIYEDSFQS